jgi:hypothetical protein
MGQMGQMGQMGMSYPPQYATPFIYYNNPYGMMGMPGFSPNPMTQQNPNIEQQNLNSYEQMKNIKNSTDEQSHPGQNYYYGNFYKQA